MSRSDLQKQRRALDTPAARYMRGEISAAEYAQAGRDNRVDYMSGALAIVKMRARAESEAKNQSTSTS